MQPSDPYEFEEIAARLSADPEFRELIDPKPNREPSIKEVLAMGAGVLAVGAATKYHPELYQGVTFAIEQAGSFVGDLARSFWLQMRNPGRY